MRRAFPALVASLALVATALHAHDGPPFPILADHVTGAYRISLWTDPDSTDDGSAGGQFWVVLRPADTGATLPPDTVATVAIAPVERPDEWARLVAGPVADDPTQRFAALVMDHEGRYVVEVRVDGPLGSASARADVEATYDQRPAPWLFALYLMPFVLVGGLWLKVLAAKRRPPSDSTARGPSQPR